ncbi:MAG: EamA/RhaT family transporter [Candidatus Methylacidiphilales bacterium]
MIFLLLSIIASTITVSFFKIFERVGVNTLQGIIFNYITCAVLGNLFTNETPVITTDFYNQPWFPYTLLLGFLFISIFFAIGETSQKMGVSVSMVSAKLSVVVPIVFALLFFSESLTVLQIAGIVLSLLAVYFISQKHSDGSTKTKNIWILPAIVFIGSGIIDTTLNFIQKRFIPAVSEAYVITTVFSIAFILGALFLTYLVVFKNEKVAFKNVYWGIFLGIPNYFSMLFLVKTLSYFPTASATIFPINNIGIVAASTLVSVLFFKEKLNTKNIIGLALSLMAIALISIQF